MHYIPRSSILRDTVGRGVEPSAEAYAAKHMNKFPTKIYLQICSPIIVLNIHLPLQISCGAQGILCISVIEGGFLHGPKSNWQCLSSFCRLSTDWSLVKLRLFLQATIVLVLISLGSAPDFSSLPVAYFLTEFRLRSTLIVEHTNHLIVTARSCGFRCEDTNTKPPPSLKLRDTLAPP